MLRQILIIFQRHDWSTYFCSLYYRYVSTRYPIYAAVLTILRSHRICLLSYCKSRWSSMLSRFDISPWQFDLVSFRNYPRTAYFASRSTAEPATKGIRMGDRTSWRIRDEFVVQLELILSSSSWRSHDYHANNLYTDSCIWYRNNDRYYLSLFDVITYVQE